MVVTVPRAPGSLQTPPRPREDVPRRQSTHDPSRSPPLHARSSGASPCLSHHSQITQAPSLGKKKSFVS